ncbi:MAG: hypothetical protein IJV31_09230 [Clostridia bacterium]|nr:hypothetical protein [Clostridia bacterium]
MNEEKIDLLLNILENLSLEEWNKIKNEVDITYRDVEYKKVPNSQLGTLRNNLMHELKL